MEKHLLKHYHIQDYPDFVIKELNFAKERQEND